MTVQEEKQIKEYAEMYARNLVLYGVDVRDKLESATSISASLNQAYMKGRSDECKRFKSAMAELQTYRSLGTVEELKEAREKQIPKKPIMKTVVFCDEAEDVYVCSVCESEIGLFKGQPYCENRGTKVDWGEEDEV